MTTKLTLSIDKEVIEQAKVFAKSSEMSLSRIIENYLRSLIRADEKQTLSPISKSLMGSVELGDVREDKAGYSDYLSRKHAK